mmetsp:Transcript_15376/g.46421  ORF Transcript_15376/g.46421 Transcript_15376/m.46421 type:complete len:243 (-) Transcript_15376:1315-2043(-)
MCQSAAALCQTAAACTAAATAVAPMCLETAMPAVGAPWGAPTPGLQTAANAAAAGKQPWPVRKLPHRHVRILPQGMRGGEATRSLPERGAARGRRTDTVTAAATGDDDYSPHVARRTSVKQVSRSHAQMPAAATVRGRQGGGWSPRDLPFARLRPWLEPSRRRPPLRRRWRRRARMRSGHLAPAARAKAASHNAAALGRGVAGCPHCPTSATRQHPLWGTSGHVITTAATAQRPLRANQLQP